MNKTKALQLQLIFPDIRAVVEESSPRRQLMGAAALMRLHDMLASHFDGAQPTVSMGQTQLDQFALLGSIDLPATKKPLGINNQLAFSYDAKAVSLNGGDVIRNEYGRTEFQYGFTIAGTPDTSVIRHEGDELSPYSPNGIYAQTLNLMRCRAWVMK